MTMKERIREMSEDRLIEKVSKILAEEVRIRRIF